jgi:hypothetical protein
MYTFFPVMTIADGTVDPYTGITRSKVISGLPTPVNYQYVLEELAFAASLFWSRL